MAIMLAQLSLQLEGQDTQITAPDIVVKSESPIVIGATFKITSSVLKADRELNVWLPPGYEEGKKKYPVLYVIDGGLDQDFLHISGLSQLAVINNNYHPLIVVGIKTENRIDELTQKPVDPRYVRTPPRGGKSELFMDYISQEVIPFVEGKYRVNDRRAVVGESLGGLFIAEVFLRRPAMFTDYICVSPSLWWDDRALAKDAKALLANHDDQPRQLYLTMADEGGTMQSGLDTVMAAIKENKPAGLKWSYMDRRKTETHSTIYHGAAHDALRSIFDIPATVYPGPEPWYLTEGGQPPKEKE